MYLALLFFSHPLAFLHKQAEATRPRPRCAHGPREVPGGPGPRSPVPSRDRTRLSHGDSNQQDTESVALDSSHASTAVLPATEFTRRPWTRAHRAGQGQVCGCEHAEHRVPSHHCLFTIGLSPVDSCTPTYPMLTTQVDKLPALSEKYANSHRSCLPVLLGIFQTC